MGQNTHLIVVEMAVSYHEKSAVESDTRTVAIGDFIPAVIEIDSLYGIPRRLPM
jgi:hypothetical protein